MLYIKGSCPICRYGIIGFRLCSDNETIVLMCDECNTVWLDPRRVDSELALYPPPPDFVVPTLECSIKGQQALWAKKEDVAKKDWSGFVAGEAKALGET